MGGRTAHLRFKFPLKLTETSSCAINKQSHLAKLFRVADLIVWDEAPMAHRYALEAFKRGLQDITNCPHRLEVWLCY